MASPSAPPPGWQPIGDGGYRNPASGTTIYPKAGGGWQGDPTSGVGQGALGAQNNRSNPQPIGAPVSATHGLGVHGALHANAAAIAANGGMTPTQVRAMQQFLNNHGFQVAQDGVLGPLTKAAAAAFRANHKGGEVWNKAHGIGTHPGAAPHDLPLPSDTPSPSNPTAPTGPTDPSAPSSGGSQLQSLLASLLGGGGNVGSMYDAKSFGDAAAAPDEAMIQALLRQQGANPKQEAQNQSDISSWYGLDPKAKSYQLSVLGRLAQAKAGDAQAATDIQGNMGDLAKSLAGSIGGAANDGSGQVLAAGQNSAGTVAALGQAQSDYESNMDPLLRAEAVGAASREKGANSQVLADLADKLATARGQSASDRAQGVMTASDKNNSLAQQRFANQGNLLSILSQMQAADPNNNSLDNQKTKAQIAEIMAQTAKARASATHLLTPGSSGAQPSKLNVGDAMVQIQNLIPGMSGRNLPQGMDPGYVAHVIGTILQGAKIPKTDPRYQRLGQTLIGLLNDSNGNPIQAPPGWFGPNTR